MGHTMTQNITTSSRNRTQALGKLYKKITGEDMPIGANTTTEALQKVYEALTNDTTHHINVTEIIDDLATKNWSGGGGGGGGSSDFSTATVTFTNTSGNPVGVACAVCSQQDAASQGTFPIMESGTMDVILYKGSAIARIEQGSFSVVSGDVTILLDGRAATINGDCTLSIVSGHGPN